MREFYFCESCREKVKDMGRIHYIEENSDRGFCSEDCILKFYRPYMKEFEKEEVSFRKELNLKSLENNSEVLGSSHYLNQALKYPTEIWEFQNQLGQKFYTHILDIDINSHKNYFILICSYVENEASFVFYRTITSYEELKSKYQISEKLVVEKEFKEEIKTVSDDLIEQIELKKSGLLAHILVDRSEVDIPIEEFPKYDKYMELTYSSPDEQYEYIDQDDEVLHLYVKNFFENDQAFFYYVFVFPINEKGKRTEGDLPIIGMPSTDKDLYLNYISGKKLKTNLEN